MFDADKAKRLVKLARDDDAALPAGPWEVWTSNSFRRISGPDGRDGGVLHATKQRDGHPDLSAGPEMLTALCRMRNRHADLADQLAAACQEVERLTRERDDARAEWQGADGKADWYAKECERLRKLVGEACDIGMGWAYLLNVRHDLATIRRDAGLGDDTPSDV